MVNYKELAECLRNRLPYRHGSSTAYGGNELAIANQAYTVYSYNTLILRAVRLDYGTEYTVTYYDNRKYSRTTSRLQRLIEQAFDLDGAVGTPIPNGLVS